MSDVLAYLAAALIALWGIMHVLPTKRVVAAFEPIAPDNRWMLIQEWLAEAVTMWGLSALLIATTVVTGGGHDADVIYRVVAAILAALALLTALTGARTAVVWFKVCVGLLALSAVLVGVASAA